MEEKKLRIALIVSVILTIIGGILLSIQFLPSLGGIMAFGGLFFDIVLLTFWIGSLDE